MPLYLYNFVELRQVGHHMNLKFDSNSDKKKKKKLFNVIVFVLFRTPDMSFLKYFLPQMEPSLLIDPHPQLEKTFTLFLSQTTLVNSAYFFSVLPVRHSHTPIKLPLYPQLTFFFFVALLHGFIVVLIFKYHFFWKKITFDSLIKSCPN